MDAFPASSTASLSSDDASLVPISRAELDQWYTHHLLSLHEIAERTSLLLGIPITKTKVRKWLLSLQIPRRSFSQAAQKRRASQANSPERPAQPQRPAQLPLFPDEDTAL